MSDERQERERKMPADQIDESSRMEGEQQTAPTQYLPDPPGYHPGYADDGCPMPVPEPTPDFIAALQRRNLRRASATDRMSDDKRLEEMTRANMDLQAALHDKDAKLHRLQRSLAQMQAMYDERGSRILQLIADNDALRGDPAPTPDATPAQEAAYAAELNASVLAEMARIASIPEPAPIAGGEPVTPRVLAWLATQAVNVGEDAVSRAVALVLARDAYGRAKYGQALSMGDGRDTVEDLRQELGDALQYGIKARAEGVEGEHLEELRDLAHLVWLLLCADNVEVRR